MIFQSPKAIIDIFQYIAVKHKSIGKYKDGRPAFFFGEKFEMNNQYDQISPMLYLRFSQEIRYRPQTVEAYFTMMILSKFEETPADAQTDKTLEYLKYQEISACEKIGQSIIMQLYRSLPQSNTGMSLIEDGGMLARGVTVEDLFGNAFVGVSYDLGFKGTPDRLCVDMFDSDFNLKTICL